MNALFDNWLLGYRKLVLSEGLVLSDAAATACAGVTASCATLKSALVIAVSAV